MKTTHRIFLSLFCLAFGVANAQNGTVKKIVTNAANNAIQKVINGVGQGNGANPLSGATVSNFDNGLNFTITGCKGDPAAQRVTIYFRIANPTKPHQRLSVGDSRKEKAIVAMDENSIEYHNSSIGLGGQVINENNQSLDIWKQLPQGLSINGSLTFINVMPSITHFALVRIWVSNSNFDGSNNETQGWEEARNIPIDWSTTTAAIINNNNNNNSQTPPVLGDQNIVKTLANDIGFTVTGCTGDKNAQTVTLFFTLANPSKPHQRIQIGDPYSHNDLSALDANSNVYQCSRITLGSAHGEGGYPLSTSELPSGQTINGSATFTNVMPDITSFALVNIYEMSSNWEGGDNAFHGNVEVRNVPITWVKPTAPAKPLKKTH
jgi:hypothetical protein